MDSAEPSSSNTVMEKLHEKFARKPWNDTMKLVRLCMDKPHQTTSTATSACPITSCLGKIERTLHAESLSAVVNKLESLSKKIGLNSYASPSGTTYYISSEKFYIEIYLENDGTVKDVKVAYPTKPLLPCAELFRSLRIQNYDAFGKTLEHLLTLYQIPGKSCTNIKGQAALHNLEEDLCLLSTLHRTPDMDRITEILSGKVGYIKPRGGGKPLSIEFYLSPYQILEEQFTPGLQISGMMVFVTIGQARERQTLALSPLVVDSVSGEDGSPNFKFLPLTEVLCVDTFACFLLKFRQPFPMFLSSIHELQKLTGIPIAGSKPAPLHELIVQLAVSEKCKDDPTMSNYFFVSLPDCPKMSYFMDTSTDNGGLTGSMIDSVPFAHCKCVPDMIEILRHQTAYNTLVSSCTSAHTSCEEDLSDLLCFEVSPQRDSSLSVTFQHPLQDNLACVVIDVLSSREVKCTLHTISEDGALDCSNDFLTRVLNRCMSIPILMRAIYKRATQQKAAQSMEGTPEQNPNQNKESKEDPSAVGLPRPGDSTTTSVSPEGSLPGTSRQASLHSCSTTPEGSLPGTSRQASLHSDSTITSLSPEGSLPGTSRQASLHSGSTTTSVSPEGSLPGTSRQASLHSGTEDNASVETSGDGRKENMPLQLSEDKVKDDMYLASLLMMDDEESLSASSPGIQMDDFDMDYFWFFPE